MRDYGELCPNGFEVERYRPFRAGQQPKYQRILRQRNGGASRGFSRGSSTLSVWRILGLIVWLGQSDTP